ncbi:MAG: NAD(P)H-binding protein [Ktedonobacterales bacterium]
MQSAPLPITGATGRVGGRVARRLAAASVPQRLLVRDPARAPQHDGVELAQGSYGDGDFAVRSPRKCLPTRRPYSGSAPPPASMRHRQ